jgi:hypothetical protein
MATRRADLTYGFQRETFRDPHIQAYTGKYMMKLNPSNVMDWMECIPTEEVCELAEQKARKIDLKCATYYNTLIIGKNKVDAIARNGKGTIYFDLLDGLFSIKYNKELFDTFFIERDYLRGERSDCVDRPSDVVHIPLKSCLRVC